MDLCPYFCGTDIYIGLYCRRSPVWCYCNTVHCSVLDFSFASIELLKSRSPSVACGDREEKEQMECFVALKHHKTLHLLFFKWDGMACQADVDKRQENSTCKDPQSRELNLSQEMSMIEKNLTLQPLEGENEMSKAANAKAHSCS